MLGSDQVGPVDEHHLCAKASNAILRQGKINMYDKLSFINDFSRYFAIFSVSQVLWMWLWPLQEDDPIPMCLNWMKGTPKF